MQENILITYYLLLLTSCKVTQTHITEIAIINLNSKSEMSSVCNF